MKTVNIITMILVIIGAINWLLVGLFGFDLVASLFANGFGTLSVVSRIVYLLVGLSGLWLLFVLLPRVSEVSHFNEAPSMPTA